MIKKLQQAVFFTSLLLPGVAHAACDVPHMFAVLPALPEPTTIVEIEQLKQESTDGGVWAISLDERGIPLYITLMLNGESGYAELKYIRFTDGGLLISTKDHVFATNAEFTAHSAHCEDRVAVTIMKNPEVVRIAPGLMNAGSALEMSENDKKRLFESPEIAAYLVRMKEW
jgi:hypothetical protein